jgi:hypothetical protein
VIFHTFLFDFFFLQDKSAPPVCVLLNPMAIAAVGSIGGVDFPIEPWVLFFRNSRSDFSFSEMDGNRDVQTGRPARPGPGSTARFGPGSPGTVRKPGRAC